ncbi:SHOCT domain-containing protein [Halorubrum vacuolatum]|uniref:TIGR04222 domain-containing protein n=1 Tax=Halorubrum vacuolatum TaxID=63740 RepID=A0A238WSU9_HALVU|nr:SHOCT domain-containing protein [Halorubrum vacuolatum]SNR49617.1 TIGR04222 domain-containing protein [Halorubrum vacuolatum]
MSGLLHRVGWNLRRRWRRVFALLVIGAGVLAPFLTGLWWTLPLVWFLGLFILLPLAHTLAKPIPEGDDDRHRSRTGDTALDALRERYARGEIDEETFERKLDRLLETEDATPVEREGTVTDQVRENVRREVERIRE